MSNLDDFFKKRDKKKKVACKSKFSTLDTEELAKNLEATAASTAALIGESNEGGGIEGVTSSSVLASNNVELTSGGTISSSVDRVTTTSAASNEHGMDDEWKPFDSDEAKDYTGLRINIENLKVEDENNENLGTTDENEKKTACPWGSRLPGAQSASNNQSQRRGQLEDNDDDSSLNNETDMTTISSVTRSSSNPSGALSDTTNQKTSAEIAATKSEQTVTAESTSTSASSSSTAPGAYIPPALRRQQQQQQQTVERPATTTTTTTTTSSETGKYVPPSMRNRTAESNSTGTLASGPSNLAPMVMGAGGGGGGSLSRRNKAQPNINDTFEFPTLDAAGGPTDSAKGQDNAKSDDASQKFEFSKKSGRVESKSSKDSSIDLQNKYTALSN